MAEETTTPIETEEPFETFFARENAVDFARMRGDAPVDTSEAVVEEPVTEEEPEVEATPDPARKTDGRTLEGRREKIYKQVEELTAQRHQTQREVEETRAELARLKEELSRSAPPQRQPVAAATTTEDPEPKIEDFVKLADGSENHDPYTTWMRQTQKWEARQAARETQHAMLAQAAEVHAHQSWETKVDAAEKSSPGLREKLRTATVPIHRDTLPYIKRHPMGAEIAAYLVDHEDTAQRLVTLHPVEQIGQIGEIVGELKALAHAASSGSAAPARPVSQAKAPKQPLGTTPVATTPEPGDEESVESHIRRNNAADRKRGRL